MKIYSPLERVHNQTGGSNGRLVRLSAANTWQNAEPTDTLEQLSFLMFLHNGVYVPPGECVYGLSGLTAGAAYYLGAGGTLTTVPPNSPDNAVLVGQALDSTTLFFYPKRGADTLGGAVNTTTIFHRAACSGSSDLSANAFSLTAKIQAEVDTLPGYGTTLVGFWLLGYDMVANESAANNQTVKDWSGFENHGLRGNSATPNTSSPNGTSFDGDDFVQVPYAANMNTASTGAVTLGLVAAQSVAQAGVYLVSQNNISRAIYYTNDGRSVGYFTRYRIAASNRVLNASEHYMATGDSGIVYMYKNGSLSSGTILGTYNASVNSQPLYIGRRSSGDYFTGNIHCVYMYANSAQDANAAAINTTINNILALL